MNKFTSQGLISIIMPVKNAGLYLDECIQSIINQEEKNWELLAVNDNSDDNSRAIMEKYSLIDQRITVLDSKGQGIIDALQSGFQDSNGSFITRMDADDIMPICKLKVLKEQLEKKGQGHIATGFVKYFSANTLGDGYIHYEAWLNKLTKDGSNFNELYKECVIPSPCWMLYRSDFESIGSFDSPIYPEDYDLVFRMYKGGLTVIPTDKILHHWRDYAHRTSRTDENYMDNRFLEIKCSYFLQLDYDKTKELILWGAGKKGKAIAKYLVAAQIPFRWICNNERKIGREIYGKILETVQMDFNSESMQFIISVAIPDEQAYIKQTLAFSGCIEMKQTFFFC